MEALDLKTKEEWEDILNQFARDTNMTACLTDVKGNHITCSFERYPLCKAIRENQDALTYICSQTSAAMSAVVEKTRRTELDMCDAGLFRVVVPILNDSSLVGLVSACGLASKDEDDEVNAFLVAKELNTSEEQIEELAKSTPFGTEEDLERIANDLFNQLNNSDTSQP